MFVAYHRTTGKIACAMVARDLAEAMGYRCLGVDCQIAWFAHADLSRGIDGLRVMQQGGNPVLVIG